MEKIYYNIDYDLNMEKYFDNSPVCFLDIETTGFSRAYDTVYLVGLLIYNNGKYTLKQYFLNSSEKEDCILKTLIEDIENSVHVVTFNGDTFDIPFLNSKYKKYDIKYQIPKNKSIDIYRTIRNNKELLPLKSFKLKSIEKFLGIYREDTISGKDCIDLYYDYLKSNDLEKRKLILKHNYDDLYYLPFVLKMLDIIDDNKIVYLSNKSSNHKNNPKIAIESIDFINDVMKIYCKTTSFKKDSYIDYGNYYNLNWDFKEGTLYMEFQIEKGLLSTEKKCFYINLDNLEYGMNIKDCTSFNIPPNIMLLKVDKRLAMENIKGMIKYTIESKVSI
ncbi:ribonuclease H-like domain-containing protein [Anaerosalibacter massiliensis]|uniref:Ribonuclease H-like domain-containing protein n=1 Tax=Anaerosalibacter massiliensis TaxID=1347392 RepID=A0A9X2S6N3_9FIRM|nr:ribonuclease H-like domain-containing protein [Anaerosalibacter massiliensis]MCR2045554.1 ribonuclease H-like domain-containing protein [Anaerosalibacter massiliensis]